MIVECCKCGMIRVGEEWLSVETWREQTTTAVSHTYCPPCLDVVVDQFSRQREHQETYGYTQ